MTMNHLKMAVEPTPKLSYISNKPQIMENVPQTFRESIEYLSNTN
jgi:hypothetical protein